MDTIKPTDDEILMFLDEDVGSGGLTASIIPETIQASAQVITRQAMTVCSQAWFNTVFTILNPDIQIQWQVTEGAECKKNTLLCTLKGRARDLLTGERTALNLLQTLSATASIARRYATAVQGTGCKVLDTRKTIPGLRRAQKYAVSCGGCFNHRKGLYDAVLIKENHILASGSIGLAIKAARRLTTALIEVEVESLAEYQQAITAKPDRIMLDNFSLQATRRAVAIKPVGIELEASGDITLDNIRDIAETGVDFISIGALTKHIKAIDLSMRIVLD